MAAKRNPIYDSAYELYLSGLSLDEVGQKIGQTRQSVFKAFKKRGFELRQIQNRPEQTYDGKKFTLRNSGYYGLTTDERTLMHRYVWEAEIGPIPEGWDIHHINEDKSDNRIGNFECLPKAEHTRKYSPHNNQYTKGRKRVAEINAEERRENEGRQLSEFARNDWDVWPTQPPVCSRNDGLPKRLDDITFSKWRNESIKALGNAVVPQVIYQIFKAIEQYTKCA